MKLVLAYLQPHKLEAATLALRSIPHFPGMTVTQARGFGRERGEFPPQTVVEELEEFSDKVRIETVLNDDQVDRVIDGIARAAHTGRYGDGMIFVLPVERAVRISTRHEGEAEI